MNFEKGSVQKARRLTEEWIEKKLAGFSSSISIGLPEYDDRHNKWRVPLNLENGKHLLIGEVSIDASLNEIIDFTDIRLIQRRIKKYSSIAAEKNSRRKTSFALRPFPTK
jgi:hypothetical protein